MGVDAVWLKARWGRASFAPQSLYETRGASGTQVVLWKPTTSKTDTDDSGEAGGPRRRLLARAYTVFAAEQVDGADEIIARRARQLADRDTPERIEAAEAFFAAVGARVVEGGNRACYQPVTDTVHLPSSSQFDEAAQYYGTSAHEHVHWTGHADRVARDLTGRFGSDAYAAEELVAELGAAMWCAQFGISAVTRPDHAAYLAGWLRVLRTDARALVTVSSRAQAALDHLTACAEITAPGHEGDTTEDSEAA